MQRSKTWAEASAVPVAFSTEFPHLHPIVRQLLYNRNVRTSEQVEQFLYPDYARDVHDPFLFRDMRTAVERIFKAIEQQQRIVVHGDYDADGVCGSAVLCTTLRDMGAAVGFFLPHREKDGYGLSMSTVEKLAGEETSVIITCDCGISNKPEITAAHALGIDVIITDHHQEPESLPDKAIAILHPKIAGETYPDKTLSGGGVAFKLCQALLREHAARGNAQIAGMRHEAFEKWLLDLVAISSVADMVPLLQETRVLTRYGLVVLNKTRRLGLKKLIDTVGRITTIDAGTIGFRIAPRINAAGRMQHANEALSLLLAQTETEADQLAARIHAHNTDRQKLTEELTKAARRFVQEHHDTEKDPILFVRGDGWSPGIIGLIASRLKDTYFKPVVVLGEGNGTYIGSGRSIPQFHITAALQEIPQFFLKFGGHPQACGFSLRNKDVYDEFTIAMREIATRELRDKELLPLLEIESEVHLDAVDWALWQTLERFAPFGVGNPEPLFLARDVLAVDIVPLGASGKHMRLLARQRNGKKVHKFVAFSCQPWLEMLELNDTVDLVFQIGLNDWNGRQELQLTIVDLKKRI